MQSAFTITEAAAKAGISRSTAYQEIRRGKLRVRKIGRRSIVTDEDYRRWLDGLPVVAAAVIEPAEHGQAPGHRRRKREPAARSK
jgi:excisionase family DNA binding protein